MSSRIMLPANFESLIDNLRSINPIESGILGLNNLGRAYTILKKISAKKRVELLGDFDDLVNGTSVIVIDLTTGGQFRGTATKALSSDWTPQKVVIEF
jgi:hypothetical protein